MAAAYASATKFLPFSLFVPSLGTLAMGILILVLLGVLLVTISPPKAVQEEAVYLNSRALTI